MSLQVTERVAAFFGQAGSPGEPGDAPPMGPAAGGNATPAETLIGSPTIYAPVLGDWDNEVVADDWTVSAAGLFTYTGTPLWFGSVSYKFEATPLAAGVKTIRSGLALNGDSADLIANYNVASEGSEDDPAYHYSTSRRLMVSGWTLQLFVSNVGAAGNRNLDTARASVVAG